MSAQPVQKKDPITVAGEFPIAGVVDGWFFRQREVSNGAFVVEGTDLWGRKVSRNGVDPEALLGQCALDAQLIEQRTSAGLPTHSHTGRELELMLDGRKPLAMFYAGVGELPNEDLVPEERFAPFVASGQFVRGEMTEEGQHHAGVDRNVLVKYIFFAYKAEAWRIEAMKLLRRASGKSGWSETCERIEGSLLGYTDEENDAHCRGRFSSRVA
jgi:hypothetical protein